MVTSNRIGAIITASKKDLNLMAVMSRLDKYRVLIIDDIGYIKKMTQKIRFYLSLLLIVMKVAA